MIKQFFGYLSGEIVYKIFVLVIFYLLVNQLSKEEYALYGIILANVAFFSMFIRFAQHAVISRYFYDKEKDYDKIIGVSIIIFVVTTTIFLISSWFLFGFYEDYIGQIAPNVKNYPLIISLIIGISILSFFQEVALSYTNARKKVIWHVSIKSAQVFVTLVVALVLIKFTHTTLIIAYLTGWFFSYFVITLFDSYYVIKHHNITFSTTYLKEILNFSAPLFIHNLSLLAMIHINKFLLVEYSTVEAVAGITFIINLSVIIESLVMIFNRTWMPNFYEFLNKGKNKESNYLMRQIFIIFSLLIVVFILLNKEIIFFISKDSYTYLSLLNSIYITSVFFKFIYLYYSQFIFHLKKTHLLLRITLISAVINVLLNYFAIKFYALNGAVAVFVISQMLVSILAYFTLRNKGYIYVPYKTFLIRAIIFAVSVFSLVFLIEKIELGFWYIFAIKLFIGLVISYFIIKKILQIIKYEKMVLEKN